MSRAATDVPLARDASQRFLPWLVAFMVYLAVLAFLGALAVHKGIQRWDSGLAGHLTVEIPLTQSENGADDQDTRVAQALHLLQGTKGVIGAAQLAPSEIAKLLEPWLGTSALDEELPLPALIAVTIDSAAPPDLATLAASLEQAVPGALVDDHQRWLGRLLDLARSVQIIAALIVLLVATAAILAIIFVTRTGLSIHRQVIELLHLIGAHDAYIARQFQRHALKLGLRGGIIGMALALATVLPVAGLLARADSALLPQVSLSPIEWGILMLMPVATALVAMITARLTVLGTLSRMP